MIPVFLDFETYYSKDYSLKKMSTQQYIYNPEFKVHGCGVAIGKGAPRWFPGAVLDKVLPRLVPGNVIVCHNANFDAAILAWRYKLYPRLIIDTVSLSRAIVGEKIRSHSLDSIAQFLLQEAKGGFLSATMGIRDLNPAQEQQLAQYCLKDVDLCRRIFYTLVPHIPKHELLVMDLCSRAYTQPKLWLDIERLVNYHSKVVATRLRALDDAGIEDAIEVRSNPRFAKALEALGVVPPMKTSPTTGKPAYAFAKTDEGMLELQEHPDERVQALVAARLENKSTLAESRCESFMSAHQYGEFPIPYLFSGAQTTHRWSGGGGFNLQNLPRSGELRKAIIAPVGMELTAGDLSQIELRGTLQLAVQLLKQLGFDWRNSEEQKALDILRDGGDLYSTFGSSIYRKIITKKDNPHERQVSKSAVLGLGFGMAYAKFIQYCRSQGIEVDEDFARYVVKLYRGLYTGVVRLWRYMQDCVKEFVYYPKAMRLFEEPDVWIQTTSLYGDPCIGVKGELQIKYPGLAWDVEEKAFTYDRALGKTTMFAGKFVENLVQYLARQIIMQQSLKVSRIKPVVMSTHDEIVTLKDEGDSAWPVQLAQIMTERLAWWPSIPLGAEVKVGRSYGEMEVKVVR